MDCLNQTITLIQKYIQKTISHRQVLTYIIINILRFYLCVCLSVCLSVTDVGVAVTNLRVVCKIITCVPAVTSTIIFRELEIVKAAAGRDTQRFRLREGCHCGRLPSH